MPTRSEPQVRLDQLSHPLPTGEDITFWATSHRHVNGKRTYKTDWRDFMIGTETLEDNVGRAMCRQLGIAPDNSRRIR